MTRKLSGRNGRYRGRDDKRFLYKDDDDCDDDDDDDDNDNDDDDDDDDNYYDDDDNNNGDDNNYNGYHSAADDLKRTYRRYTYARRAKSHHGSRTKSHSRPRGHNSSQAKGRYGSRKGNGHRPPYVARVYMRGTGEQISIVFKSNHRNRRKGFDAIYSVSQGDFN